MSGKFKMVYTTEKRGQKKEEELIQQDSVLTDHVFHNKIESVLHYFIRN